MLHVAGRTAVLLLVMLSAGACRGGALLRQYEYEEETFLALDGTATVYVNASVPALVALRGIDLDVNPRARLDRGRVRTFYAAPGTHVVRVSTSRRHSRRFVHLRIEVDNVRRLSAAGPFAWSRYAFERRENLFVFRQTVGAASGKSVGDVGWNGEELVAFRLHLPSKIEYHNTLPGNLRRGNILVWEQRLTDRLAGAPVDMEARMETESILYRTLWLFAVTGLVVAAAFLIVIWGIVRKGREPGSRA